MSYTIVDTYYLNDIDVHSHNFDTNHEELDHLLDAALERVYCDLAGDDDINVNTTCMVLNTEDGGFVLQGVNDLYTLIESAGVDPYDRDFADEDLAKFANDIIASIEEDSADDLYDELGGEEFDLDAFNDVWQEYSDLDCARMDFEKIEGDNSTYVLSQAASDVARDWIEGEGGYVDILAGKVVEALDDNDIRSINDIYVDVVPSDTAADMRSYAGYGELFVSGNDLYQVSRRHSRNDY